MKKFFRGLWEICEVLIVIYAVFATVFILFKNKYGYTQLGKYTLFSVKKDDISNISGSDIGDLYVVKSVKKVKNKQIIYFYSISGDKYVVKNSKVLDYNTGVYTIEDNFSVVSSRVMGIKSFKIKYVGRFFTVIEKKLGFVLLVLVPIMIVFIYQVCTLGILLKSTDNPKKQKEEKK